MLKPLAPRGGLLIVRCGKYQPLDARPSQNVYSLVMSASSCICFAARASARDLAAHAFLAIRCFSMPDGARGCFAAYRAWVAARAALRSAAVFVVGLAA